MESENENWWTRLKSYIKNHTGLAVIVIAALLLELTTAILYYTAHGIIQNTLEILAEREMNSISITIRHQLAKVEISLDNMAWMVTDDLAKPDSLFSATKKLVKNNPDIIGCSISCIPNFYPQRGQWFEAYSARKSDGTIETKQLGSESHDYTKSEFFTEPIARGTGYWSKPYLDKDGAKTIVTSYGVPVRNANGKTVAVINADISLDWLKEIVNENKGFELAQCFLLTGKYEMLSGEDSLLCKTLAEKIKAHGKYGYFTLEVEGKLKHAFYTWVGGKTDWIITYLQDDEEVFGDLKQVQAFLLLLILSGFVLLGFIVWRTSRNLERLRQVNAEKERISSDLRVASDIQQSMLPQRYLNENEIELFGSLVPAREVGGDLFDYFIRDNKLYFYIGDVSGKGTPAALLMTSTRSLLRAFSTNNDNPAQIMQHANEAACQGNESCMFVTLFIGVLDLATGHMLYCNAGHDAPIIMVNGQQYMLDVNTNIPVGLYDGMEFDLQETHLQPSSTIFLYTDGLTEAMDSELKQFGIEQVEKVLKTCADKHPREILETVSDEVHKFVGDAEQSDDLTLFAIRYNGPTV